MEGILLISLCAIISPILVIAMSAIVLSAPIWIFAVLMVSTRMMQALRR